MANKFHREMSEQSWSKEVEEVQRLLDARGLHAALRYLNERTPYRFTGLYRFEGDTLRSVALFDRWSPETLTGADAPTGQTFCAIVRDAGDSLAVMDGRVDVRFPWMTANPVACYCGVLLRDKQGAPAGTLCHFDLQRCEPPTSEFDLLRQLRELFAQFVIAEPGAPVQA